MHNGIVVCAFIDHNFGIGFKVLENVMLKYEINYNKRFRHISFNECRHVDQSCLKFSINERFTEILRHLIAHALIRY